MKRPVWLVAIILVIEIACVLLLIPNEWGTRTIEKESLLIEKNLGWETEQWIFEKAGGWYQSLVIDSGFYDGARHMLIPSNDEKQRSRGIENMGAAYFVWIEGRLDAFCTAIKQLLVRAAFVLVWLPYMAILFVPACFDGLMTRQIKRTNFDYASPVIHYYSIKAATFVALGTAFIFILPIAINPIIVPASMMIVCVLVGLMLGNLQKRI